MKTSEDAIPKALVNLLADTYSLMAQTHVAHWNVQGSEFFSLHPALELQYRELFEAVDEIAERLRVLDVLSPGGLKTLGSISKIKDMAIEPTPAKSLVAHLIAGHDIVIASAVIVRDTAGDGGDPETEDLAVGRLRFHEKTRWMLRAFMKNL